MTIEYKIHAEEVVLTWNWRGQPRTRITRYTPEVYIDGNKFTSTRFFDHKEYAEEWIKKIFGGRESILISNQKLQHA